MRTVREVIVVEGKYDAIRVHSAVDAIVVQTDGFRIFKDEEKRALLRRYAAARGLVVLTDSDSAGAVIRNHLRAILPPEQVKMAYVPPIEGKERRKHAPSKEGLLGVEGVDNAVVIAALTRAGADLGDGHPPRTMSLTKADLYTLGLSGKPDSAARRRALLQALALPPTLSANALLDVLNVTVTPNELQMLLQTI